MAVYYAVPSDVPFDSEVLQTLIDATRDIQAWYKCATAGDTWRLAYPEVVRVYNCEQPRQYYVDNGNWWGSLLGEMDSNGVPIWESGYSTTIWAHGAGFWAGGAQCGGDADCGVSLLGVELFSEFNNPAWSGDECPGGAGVAAWPCTPLGAFAHEIGHTMGLIHPADDPATAAVANHSIMQTHWNYPDYASAGDQPWGFLTLEHVTVHSNLFMHAEVDPTQRFPSCDVVNLPDNGAPPIASFTSAVSGMSVTLTNSSTGESTSYWSFGDAETRTELSPRHTYHYPGVFTISLRASSANGMIDVAEEVLPEDGTWIFADDFESGAGHAWCGDDRWFCMGECCAPQQFCLPYPNGGLPPADPVCCDEPCYNDVELGSFCCFDGTTCLPGVGCI